MKKILTQIIETYFGKEEISKIFDYKLELDNKLLIILDSKGKELDFFYFIFEKFENIKNIDSEKIYNSLTKDDSNLNLKNIESFDKNLNFIIFSKVDDDAIGKITEELEKKAYEIEDDAYYARKKVMFYTELQVSNFDNFSLNITDKISGKVENEIKNSDNRFLLNLLSTLTFIKMKFENSSSKDNNIFENSFKILDNKIKLLGEDLNLINQKSFNDKIIYINNEDYKEDDLQIKEKEISKFEKDLIGLFTNDNLEEIILNPLITEKDEK